MNSFRLLKSHATPFLASFSLLAFTSLATESATYFGLQADEFMKRWLVLKPIPISANHTNSPDEAAQKNAFARDWLASSAGEASVHPAAGQKQKVGNYDLEWKLIVSRTNLIDLASGSRASEFAIAYAWAEIDMREKTNIFLGLGSDDAIQVWLNGKLIHENWVGRPASPDDDVVPVSFDRGKNQLLLKIQNMKGGWGFFCRLLSSEALGEKLIAAARIGDLDALGRLLDRGVDISSRGRAGLTVSQTARLAGRQDILAFLADRGADTRAELPPPEQITDRLLGHLIKTNTPGLALLVARNGKILFENGYGLADVKNSVRFTPQTKSRIGSITKQFTASAILRLQERGKLSVRDKLSKFIPDYPRGNEVTVHHLLTHTSGIHSYTSKPGFLDKVGSSIKSEDLIASFKDDPYDFDPGKKWLYNNSGYFLLSYIIEKVSRQSYANFLQATFFTPLGMTDTGVHDSKLRLEHEALGYSFENGEFSKALNWDMSHAGGAGALYSTVEDLFRWNEAVFNGKVLKEASLQEAFTPVKTDENKDDSPDQGYGYGWGIAQFRGLKEISHSGGLNGFSSFLLRLPEEKFTVAILANTEPSAPGTQPAALAHQMVEFWLGEKLKPIPLNEVNTSIAPAAFSALVGRYDYGGPIMTITRDGDRLYAQLTGQPRFEIFPTSETNYFWKVVDAQVTFVKNTEGKVVKAVHLQNGHTINAPRLEDLVEIKVDPATYGAFLGRYDYGGGMSILTVTRDGDGLFAQLTGQPKFQIFPRTTNEFFWKVVDAQVTFVQDKDGKVTKAIHHQGGRTFDAPKMK